MPPPTRSVIQKSNYKQQRSINQPAPLLCSSNPHLSREFSFHIELNIQCLCSITLLTNGSVSFLKFLIVQPARKARWLADRSERSQRDLSALWATQRASAQAVTSKWQLCTLYESIQKIPKGETTKILVALSPSIPFFPWVAPKGPFWPFFGPRGVWGRSENANLAATRKLLLEMGPTQLDY